MVASAGNAFEVAAAPLARSANDGVVNAAHGYVGGVIGAWTPYQQGVATQWQGDQHARIGAFNGLAGSSRSARTAQAQADRASWNTFASSAAPAEDGLITAWANQQKSQAVLNSVTQFNNLAAQSPNNFAGFVGQPRSVMGTYTMPLTANMNDARAISAASSTANLGPTPAPTVTGHATTSTKPQVTVGAQGQIISSNLSFWQQTKLRVSMLMHPMSSQREVAQAAGYAIVRTGAQMPSVAPIQQPTGLWAYAPVLAQSQNMGYHFQQGNYGTATFYAAAMFGDVSLVTTVLPNVGKAAVRNGARLWADDVGSIMIPRLGGGSAGAATAAASHLNAAAAAAAEKLTIDLSTMVISNGVARVGMTGEYATSVAPELFRRIAELAASQGASTLVIRTSQVVNPDLAALYTRMAARRGGQFVGCQNATIRLVEVTELGRVPTFDITFILQ